MKKVFFLCLFSLFVFTALTQETHTPDQLLEDGSFFFQEEDYQEAIFYLIRLIDTKYDNANIRFKIGICYLNIPGSESLSIPYFKSALSHLSGSYSPRSTKETQAPYHTWFYLGQAYRINNEMENALEAFQSFKETPQFEKNYNQSIVDNEISACEIAKIIQDIPIGLEVHNPGEPINDVADNYSPVVSGNGQRMVYMTDLKFYPGIFMSDRTEEGWGIPQNITPQVESDGDAVPSFLSFDGTEMLLIKGNGNNRDIYQSSFRNGFWTKMEALPGPVNTARDENSASLSPNGKKLFFSSNQKGSLGESDIFCSEKTADKSWSEPVNLGPVINTGFNEVCPYLSEDGSLLFFASEGHYNMGGYDIFYSKLDSAGNWQDPVNMGYPLNTTGDNPYFFPVHMGNAGYISDIKPEGKGGRDIYYLELSLTSFKKELFEGNIGQDVDFSRSFSIRITDQITGNTITELVYDPEQKVFVYRSENKGLNYLIKNTP